MIGSTLRAWCGPESVRGGLMRRLLFGCLGLLAAAATLSAAAPAKAASGDYIVVLRSGVSLQAHLKALKITPNRLYTYSATGYEAVLNDTQYQRELASPDVTIVAPNVQVPGVSPLTKPSSDPAPQPAQSPTNGVRRVGALSSPTAAIDGVDTRVDVDVAVVDSGVDATHPDLNVVGGVDCSGSNSPNGFLNWKSLGKGGVAYHGTMVAGFVGAIDNQIGKVGVAPGARIWSVQVQSGQSNNISPAALMCAVDWITAHASTIEVANLSLAGLGPETANDNCGIAPQKKDGDPLHAAICASVAAGVTYVVGAGNDNLDADQLVPARYPEVITVSAIADNDGQPGGLGGNLNCLPEIDDTFAFFSNFGAVVDIAAPGVCISSTYPGGLYAVGSGTSYATPLVAGAAALYKATHPSATPAQVRAALIAAADPGPIPEDPDSFPEGVLDVSSL